MVLHGTNFPIAPSLPNQGNFYFKSCQIGFDYPMRRLKSCLVLLLICSSWIRAEAHIAVEEMSEAANAFLASLSPELKAKGAMEFESDLRHDWHYVPKERKGISLKELDKKQKDLVHELLDSAMSRKGLIKANTIIDLEKVLFEMEKKNPIRDSENYFVLIFGEPSEKGTWGWRFEGHHLSLNFTIVKGEFVTGTPHFMGSNPGEVMEGEKKGTRPLALEEDLGRQLVTALDEDQRKTAIFSDVALKEIVSGASRTVKPLEPAGLAFSDMNKEQGELLLNVMREYIYRYRAEIADDDWKKIRTAGFEDIHFAWAGSIEKGKGYYYRVQGPTFLLECDNTQGNANHIHTVWRDFQNDFGEDLLKRHYQRTSHPDTK